MHGSGSAKRTTGGWKRRAGAALALLVSAGLSPAAELLAELSAAGPASAASGERGERGDRRYSCDVLIVGGGTGGTAAAIAAAEAGRTVCLLEDTDWLGG